MKRHSPKIAVALVVLLAGSVVWALNSNDRELETTLMALEHQLWAAWQNSDSDTFEALMADDAIMAGGMGVWDRPTVISQIGAGDCDVESFSLGDPRVLKFSEDVVLITYSAEQAAVCEGFELPRNVQTASVYVRRDNAWKNSFFMDSPLFTEE